MPGVVLKTLTKRYGDLAAVEGLSLEVGPGELVSLLGPSGCGKTTTLRLVAGFLQPETGEIWVGERCLSSPTTVVPPERRRMAMIFQSYALWPHMTVAQNVAYGLRFKSGVSKADRDRLDANLREKCDSRSGASTSPSASPPSTSPTTGRKRWSSLIASQSCIAGASCRSERRGSLSAPADALRRRVHRQDQPSGRGGGQAGNRHAGFPPAPSRRARRGARHPPDRLNPSPGDRAGRPGTRRTGRSEHPRGHGPAHELPWGRGRLPGADRRKRRGPARDTAAASAFRRR